ncbi:cobalt-precorrin 5A hydrolase [Thermohalobacter berrensis]|uniref:Cobalamin biosynthesis protein CbiG n=1 Tax=Thermohalobacter berrensis TaxID=99594 RepID=A0A419SZM0_9FIRM|nr:cobalt-precorrin 5A hydrolase [Thermohalobacter berrensis]RKD30601.1 hypothetical protein BET03_04485 [Thermohalobacter berrensis]
MKWAVITLTRGALSLGKRIKRKIPDIDLYTQPKWNDTDAISIAQNFKNFVGNIFTRYEVIIFIMATGIVVRTISEYIEDKTKDPGVLVIDEEGNHVISLLSGHIGGANSAAVKVAELIGAKPIITTASDVKNTIAVDTLAMKLNCEIENLEDAKKITSLIVNDEIVEIKSDIKIRIPLPKNIILNDLNNNHNIKGTIHITNKKIIDDHKSKVHLIPKNIVIGIGCRRGIPKKSIINAIDTVLNKLNLHPKSIKNFATVDIKRNEKGLIEASNYYNVSIKIFTKNEIKKVENKFNTSEFVRKTIGVGAVCEPCAYLSSNKGKFLLKKTSFNGITIAVWEEEI